MGKKEIKTEACTGGAFSRSLLAHPKGDSPGGIGHPIGPMGDEGPTEWVHQGKGGWPPVIGPLKDSRPVTVRRDWSGSNCHWNVG